MVFCPSFEVFLVMFFFARRPYPLVVILEILVLAHAIFFIIIVLAIARVLVIIFLIIDPFAEASEFPGGTIFIYLGMMIHVTLAGMVMVEVFPHAIQVK